MSLTELSHKDAKTFVWVIRTGRKGEREGRSLAEATIMPGMGFGAATAEASTVDSVKTAIKKLNPALPNSKVTSQANQYIRFRDETKPGDTVVMPSKLQQGRLYVGTVAGRAYFDSDESDPEAQNKLPVNWHEEWITRDELGQDLQNSLRSLLTIFKITRNNAANRIEQVLDGDGDPERESDLTQNSEAILDWDEFFEELGTKLANYHDDRASLIKQLTEAAEGSDRPSLFKNLWTLPTVDGERREATDIDPFTVLAIINRQITVANKIAICRVYKETFDIDAPIPTGFDGVPERNNLSTRFESKPADIGNPEFYNAAWELFLAGIRYAESSSRDEFIKAFDLATDSRSITAYTMGLYWFRPGTFLALDSKTRNYLNSPNVLGPGFTNQVRDGQSYLEALEQVQAWMTEEEDTQNNFAELSAASYTTGPAEMPESESSAELTNEENKTENASYTYENIRAEGAFLESSEIQKLLRRWSEKKNLILQGPPGTGKTWLARKLAYALIGKENDENITTQQFHPSTSYEDFVMGYRPARDGRLELQYGAFMKAAQGAQEDAGQKHIFIIEEINRGNPAQIFGEMLTLLEADKRNPDNALRLIYSQDDDDPFHLPENFYVIGTMNQADRSLAGLDIALRRRFSFATLKPELGSNWLEFAEKRGHDTRELRSIANQITQVNALISEDPTLGAPFCIGHSFVTPRTKITEPAVGKTQRWFQEIIDTDLAPLLEEYWFSQPEKLETALGILHGSQ
ncbi:AAA family ATPase [Corynebacterium pseudodiphtheriticum]|uniref:AAA family ATPase n=2 Tax=Corynebacterium TaxID=1716 RepID=UPI00254AE71E|nr:AAA family ATPase [Corynebacterium pseudodiphtheriticum]MDK8614902.1 AAA family ATPase [Corynebacterium pseudodiphtheriticum]MDK8738963.1 AAA family ATPase [Corynebacterium pseudodiphtheriticum]MDK8745504.1 AAA family ATPase [Corynebacterium pseudodiphtheriticum]MDK8761925.1 AAA family ATPase [Corynebacterium pseudodiphtheriticum]